MSTAIRLAAFAAVLAAVFTGGWAAGTALGPLGTRDQPAPAHAGHTP